MVRIISYKEIRSDWYAGNQMMPRLVRQIVKGQANIIFKDFPRQWVPIFELYGLSWRDSVPPQEFVPIISDLSEEQLIRIIKSAYAHDMLRLLTESVAMFDPVLSDFLYIVDQSISPDTVYFQKQLEVDLKVVHAGRKRPVLLNGWQSYGRPTVRNIEMAVDELISDCSVAVILPCARQRPYGDSRTHQAIVKILREVGYNPEEMHRVVFTSLGILPEEIWSRPEVLRYDAGVPDIYRLLRLARRFFRRQKYELILDCLQFKPYSDILRILQREGTLGAIEKIPVPRKRHFYLQ